MAGVYSFHVLTMFCCLQANAHCMEAITLIHVCAKQNLFRGNSRTKSQWILIGPQTRARTGAMVARWLAQLSRLRKQNRRILKCFLNKTPSGLEGSAKIPAFCQWIQFPFGGIRFYLFRGRARRSWDGLMEPRLRRHHCHARPPMVTPSWLLGVSAQKEGVSPEEGRSTFTLRQRFLVFAGWCLEAEMAADGIRFRTSEVGNAANFQWTWNLKLGSDFQHFYVRCLYMEAETATIVAFHRER